MICRSREGAWIEIKIMFTSFELVKVAPVRERGLKSMFSKSRQKTVTVAPVRERGLKLEAIAALTEPSKSLP